MLEKNILNIAIIIFGFIGISVVFAKSFKLFISLYQEALDQNKRIEFASIIISIVALGISIIALVFSYTFK